MNHEEDVWHSPENDVHFSGPYFRTFALGSRRQARVASAPSVCCGWLFAFFTFATSLHHHPPTALTTHLRPQDHTTAVHPTRIASLAPCLAAAEPRSTSPASATAPALATLPTNSNGMSFNASSQLDRPALVVHPRLSACLNSSPRRPLPRCPRDAASSRPFPLRARPARATRPFSPRNAVGHAFLTSQSYGRLVRCDIPAPRSASSRL